MTSDPTNFNVYSKEDMRKDIISNFLSRNREKQKWNFKDDKREQSSLCSPNIMILFLSREGGQQTFYFSSRGWKKAMLQIF